MQHTSTHATTSKPNTCLWKWTAAWGAIALGLPNHASAQAVYLDLPSGLAGYDSQIGVTVLSRLKPLYDAPGVQLGGFTVRANLDENLSENSNPLGSGRSGSAISQTSVSASATSNWARNSLGTSIGADHVRYFSYPAIDYTDWHVGLGGGLTLGDDQLLARYAHNSYHQIGPAIGTTNSTSPTSNETDTAQLEYTYHFFRFSITPELDVSAYRFGAATLGGQTISQAAFDRNVFVPGVTLRYGINAQSGILVVLRDVATEYVHPQAGQYSANSNSVLMLTGIDYLPNAIWRYRLLGGAEMRFFADSHYPTETSPLVDASVIWTPTPLFTATASVSRSINDAQVAGTNGFILTKGVLEVEYELRRNVTLQGEGSVQYAEYLQGGNQNSFNLGASANWLLNRRIRVSLTYNYGEQSAISGSGLAGGNNTFGTASYRQHIVALGIHLAL